MSTHYICFCGEIRKIFYQHFLDVKRALSGAMHHSTYNAVSGKNSTTLLAASCKNQTSGARCQVF